jgi:hypothetical protein
MSKSYEQYRIASPIPKIKSYEQYRIAPTISQESPSQESPGFLGRIGQLAKGALSGFTRAGLEEAAQSTRVGVMDIGDLAVPIHPSAAMANIPEKGIEALESMRPPAKDALGNILYHAGEFGGGVASLPLGLPLGGSAKSLLGAFGKQIGTGVGIGATSGALQEGGVNPLTADIASTIIAPGLTPKNLLGSFKQATHGVTQKLPAKLMGLTPKGINLPAAQAARDLGIDLPAAALTESKLTNLADSVIGKTPFLGEKLSKKYQIAEEQTKKALEKIYNQIGPKRTPEIEESIGQLYKERTEALPKGAAIKPMHLDKALQHININSALLSTDEKNLLTSLNTLKDELNPLGKIKSSFGEIKGALEPVSLERLIGTKTSLNSIIKWEKDEGVKNLLRNVRHGLTEDIAEYGKSNPEWYNKFKQADKLYSDVAKREKIEDLLGQRGFNYATDTLSYNALAKVINNPKTAKQINRQLTPEIVNKIEKLGEVAKAMAIKNKNIPNPSGTATTAAIGGLITGLILRPWETLPAAIGSYGLTKLLTDKKFLDLAIKYAENPNKSSLLDIIALNKIIKDRTGYSAVALRNELNRVPQEVQE